MEFNSPIEEEAIFSKKKRTEMKIKEFKEYLASHDVVLAVVKFLLSLRNAKDKPEDPLMVLKDYFGEIKNNDKLNEKEEFEKKIKELQENNKNLYEEAESIRKSIELKKEEIIRKQEEERIRLEEEQMKKDKKKPAAPKK